VTDTYEKAARAGLTVLGETGTVEDVREVWRSSVSVSAVPSVRVPDDQETLSLDALESAWNTTARTHGVISDTGEFLLSVSGPGTHDRPWTRVRAEGAVKVQELGHNRDEPEFVASDLARSVTMAVTTEEYEFWILAAGPEMPSDSTRGRDSVRARRPCGPPMTG
jgi:hypothetical protein